MDFVAVIVLIGVIVGIIVGCIQILDRIFKKKKQSKELYSDYLRKVKSLYRLMSEEFAPRYVSMKGVSVTSIPQEMREKLATAASRIASDKIALVLNQHEEIVLLGDPGSGKSTLLEKLLYDHADAAILNSIDEIPFFVRLSDYNRSERFKDFFLRSVKNEFGAPSNEVSSRLKQRRALILLDGLDELPAESYDSRISDIKVFVERHRGNKFVISCRELDYNNEFDFKKLTLEPLDDDQIRTFVENYLDSKTNAFLTEIEKTNIGMLARNPYYLRMLTLVYEESDKIIKHRDELVDKFLEILILREKKRSKTSSLNFELVPVALAQFAHAMSFIGYKNSAVAMDWTAKQIPSIIKHKKRFYQIDKEEIIKIATDATLFEPLTELGAVRFYHKILFDYFLSGHFISKYTYSMLMLNWYYEKFPDLAEHEIEHIERACNKAQSIHANEKRASGDPYFFHTFAASLIVLDALKTFDCDLIVAAILHDTLQSKFGGGRDEMDGIEQGFGKRVRLLIEGHEKLSSYAVGRMGAKDVKQIMKEFDKDVIFIKLADRIHNMQTLSFLKRDKQKRIEGETKQLWIPIAQQMGFSEMAERLEETLS